MCALPPSRISVPARSPPGLETVTARPPPTRPPTASQEAPRPGPPARPAAIAGRTAPAAPRSGPRGWGPSISARDRWGEGGYEAGGHGSGAKQVARREGGWEEEGGGGGGGRGVPDNPVPSGQLNQNGWDATATTSEPASSHITTSRSSHDSKPTWVPAEENHQSPGKCDCPGETTRTPAQAGPARTPPAGTRTTARAARHRPSPRKPPRSQSQPTAPQHQPTREARELQELPSSAGVRHASQNWVYINGVGEPGG